MNLLAIGAPQIILISIALLIPLIALIDILRNEFTGYNKIVWVLVIFFLNIFGAILYFLIGRKQKISRIS